MKSVTIDQRVLDLLPPEEVAELRGPDGIVVGYFLPPNLYRTQVGSAVRHVQHLSSDPDVKTQLEALLRGLH